ncbi:MAG: Lrp/AsnC family transcriptional regulator [Bacillota bacterium]
MLGLSVELDRTEAGVLRLLQEDGRMSFVEMAERLGVAEATVRRKYNRLVSEGIVRVAAITDAGAVGYRTAVFIGLKVRPSAMADVVRHLENHRNVRYIAATTGPYDLIIEAIFRDNDEMTQFVMQELGTLDGILDSNTSMLLRIFKQPHEWRYV